MDLISVGITCYNAEDTIERAVRSAQAQTWQPLEIVAVDDCSTDRSWSILQRLASEDDRLRVFRHPVNKGVGAARNSVLENARGAFLAFFDDDDLSRPERLVDQHRRITEYEGATGSETVVCHTATDQVDPGGETRYSPTLGMDATPAPRGDGVARLILLGAPVDGGAGACPTCSQMARREVYDRVGGFDADFRRHEDTEFNLRLALAGAHFAGLSKPLVVQTMTFTRDKSVAEERRCAVQFIEKHREVLERWKWYDFSRQWTKVKYSMLDGGWASALPDLVGLFFTSPVKLARKAAWALPNRKSHKRFSYPIE